jgi:hypothetical protein
MDMNLVVNCRMSHADHVLLAFAGLENTIHTQRPSRFAIAEGLQH